MNVNLKQKLLDIELVVDNEYLDAYCSLILENSLTERIPFQTNEHHIVPVHYFQHTNQEVDNSAYNIVTLPITEHIRAHWLLARCASCEYYFYANMTAVLYTCGKYNVPPETFFSSADLLAQYEEDYRLQCLMKSEKYKGAGNPNHGSGTNHGGYFSGPHTQESKDKISNALKGRESNRKGCVVTKEQRDKISAALEMYYSVPENLLKQSEYSKKGWETRRARGTTCTTSGLHIYNNGVSQLFAESCPEGYTPGILDTQRALLHDIAIKYFENESLEKKQARIEKTKQTMQEWSDEYRAEVKAKISAGTRAARERMSQEARELMRKHTSEGLVRYHANMTAEQKAALSIKNSAGQKGKKRYRDPVTDQRKMFTPGEEPTGWLLIEYDWYIDSETGKRTRLTRHTEHDSKYIKIGERDG